MRSLRNVEKSGGTLEEPVIATGGGETYHMQLVISLALHCLCLIYSTCDLNKQGRPCVNACPCVYVRADVRAAVEGLKLVSFQGHLRRLGDALPTTCSGRVECQ